MHALWTRITVYGARSAPTQQQELAKGRGVSRIFCFDGIRFDSDSGELQVGEVTHRLASQPSQFLIALLERPGQVVTREELRRRLWPDDTFIDFDTA